MQKAIKGENYPLAAELRDEISKLEVNFHCSFSLKFKKLFLKVWVSFIFIFFTSENNLFLWTLDVLIESIVLSYCRQSL